MTPTSPPLDPRLAAAFADEEAAGQRLATRVRLIGCAAIAGWTLIENRYPGAFFYAGLAVLLGVLGLGPTLLRRSGVRGSWPAYLFPVLDAVALTVAVLSDNPLDPLGVPPQIRLRFGNELYVLLLLVSAMFSYTPRVVLWAGFATAAVWSVGVMSLMLRPDTSAWVSGERWRSMSGSEITMTLLDPNYVDPSRLGREILVLFIMAGALATLVSRSRRLVERQIVAERSHANLARYFSPNVVDELGRSDDPLRTTRAQEVAVLFVDLVGFTPFAATRSPEDVIAFLREFHARMVGTVFAHGGTVNKYLGDGLMVTFGTPHAGPDDATRALRCALAMLAAVDAWSVERVARGEGPVRIGIGVHRGPVVLGDIGDARHLEFAVVGTTVNVASRLQELTRVVARPLVVSRALVDAVRREGNDAVCTALVQIPAQTIRGLDGPADLFGGGVPV